uniref:Uncharacterized protein n=1 Tax=Avena sativa TaxID=4498 RepID=A0ACD5WVJ0_AVESA
MKKILVLILALSLGGAAGQHCDGVPSLPVEVACREACATRLMYDMCMDTLREKFDPDPSHSVAVTAYALLAAQRAVESYVVTVAEASDLLRDRSLGGDERTAYQVCVLEYGYAKQSMDNVAEDLLPPCSFGELRQEYMNGLMDLESCRDRVLRLTESPLNAMNLVDRNKALLAYFLGQLLSI